MNNEQFNKIISTSQIYEILRSAASEFESIWFEIEKDTLFQYVLIQTRGKVNPSILKKIIDEI
jgi:hypothetical protein